MLTARISARSRLPCPSSTRVTSPPPARSAPARPAAVGAPAGGGGGSRPIRRRCATAGSSRSAFGVAAVRRAAVVLRQQLPGHARGEPAEGLQPRRRPRSSRSPTATSAGRSSTCSARAASRRTSSSSSINQLRNRADQHVDQAEDFDVPDELQHRAAQPPARARHARGRRSRRSPAQVRTALVPDGGDEADGAVDADRRADAAVPRPPTSSTTRA